jgi:hypothetical protein
MRESRGVSESCGDCIVADDSGELAGHGSVRTECSSLVGGRSKTSKEEGMLRRGGRNVSCE